MTWEQRFWAKVEIGDCWQWTATVNNRGYGQFFDGIRSVYAHRFIWEQLVGAIPEGLTIDHRCQNKRCVNPDHLEVVDRAVNWRRAPHVNSRKATCPKDHPLIWSESVKRQQRICPECRREQSLRGNRKFRAKKRLLIPLPDIAPPSVDQEVTFNAQMSYETQEVEK